MNKMTRNEILELLNELGPKAFKREAPYTSDEYDDLIEKITSSALDVGASSLGCILVLLNEDVNLSLEGSQDCSLVFKYKDQCYKCDYTWSSSCGRSFYRSWETLRKVTPIDRVVTFYE